MRVLVAIIAVAIAALALGWALTRPEALTDEDIASIVPDISVGERVFHAAGCANCHAADDAKGEARLVLSGGHKLTTPAGIFVAPNISQDPTYGIGDWSRAEIVTAIMKGTSPDGRHYYPAFPYPAYAKARLSDIVSLAAYLETLPADPTPNQPHDLTFPFDIRMGIGLWKLLNLSPDFAIEIEDDPSLARGQYIAEALAHCGECHTSRTASQGLDASRWLGGAPNPSGRGRIPNITPAGLDWSAADIEGYLETGFTPDFDTAGGSMVAVIEALAQLPAEDRASIAAYLKAVPAVANPGDRP